MKPPVDLDLRYSAILPRQYAATIAAHQLPKLSELSQQEVFINEMCHPLERILHEGHAALHSLGR